MAADQQVDLDERLARSPERNSGISWPRPLDVWVDQMLLMARDHGERTTRKELVAAIVAAHKPTPEGLGELLRWYRLARVRDVVDGDGDGDAEENDAEGAGGLAAGVLHIAERRSGPRRLDGDWDVRDADRS